MRANKKFTLKELIKDLDVTLKGDPDCEISGVSMIQDGKPGHITFLANPLYKKFLSDTKASAVIVDEKHASDCELNQIIAHNPYYIYAQIAKNFQNHSQATIGVHPTAVVGKDCQIDPSAYVGPNCVIGNNVKIAAYVTISANSSIGDNVVIGKNTKIDANVSIYHDVQIGERTHIYSGAVIGSDGFGFANNTGVWHKVPQLGAVIIGNDVDVGANTTIDRGAIGNTVIADGVKLDNLIQVGHNVQIGEHTIIAGCTAIAGSSSIGKYCMIGGATCINGHISIGDRVLITGMSSVTKSITEPGVYSSGIVGTVPNHEFRKNNARFYRLENLMQRVKNLETTIKKMTESDDL